MSSSRLDSLRSRIETWNFLKLSNLGEDILIFAPLSLLPPKHYENASSLLVFIRFSDFISGKPFYIVAYMLSEIPKSRFWGRGRVLVVHEATPCFFVFSFFWELYQPAGCYRLSSAVLRKLGMVWLSADGPANSHFDFGYWSRRLKNSCFDMFFLFLS